jgi:biotin carboxylase
LDEERTVVEYVVVVDPVGTGQEYPAAFRDAGVETVAVLSTPEPAEPYRPSWHPENFKHVHIFHGDLSSAADVSALARTLREYEPTCLIPGSEPGVELADALVELVAPGTGNVPELASARRDKWAMALACQRAGIPHLRQICSADRAEIDRWLDETGLRGARLVVKPPKSAGTDNVHVVPEGEDWRPFYDQIYGVVNKVGLRNDAVLVEEFAAGTEFMIDGYSVDGKHGIVDVCRYTKSQRGDRIGIYDLVDFLAPEHPDVHAVWPYVQEVLDAVGIRNGCSHTEVILTDTGPRLLEVGARPAGGGHQMITKLATGSNHILRTVDHRVRGEFHATYELVQHVCSVVISSPRTGIWRNAEIFDGVEELKTFWAKWFGGATGDRVQATTDIYTYLGWVVLAGEDAAAVDADYRHIKALEQQIVVEP